MVKQLKTSNETIRTEEKIALAFQGSFGHKLYALGIMAAFQEYNGNSGSKNRAIKFRAASGCVEMMLPLWLYFNNANINDYLDKEINNFPINLFSPKIIPNFDPIQYWKDVFESHKKSFSNFPEFFFSVFETAGLREIANFTPAGLMTFSPTFKAKMKEKLTSLMKGAKVPIFTNAINAKNFNEVYLYSGHLSDNQLSDIKGVKGRKRKQGGTEKREVLEINAERFFASGARPPYFAPIKVHLKDNETFSGEAEDEYWMEGAMRCNPPLNPLIGTGAEKILLLRFFAKEKQSGHIHNAAEL